jgi:hypothetical protein
MIIGLEAHGQISELKDERWIHCIISVLVWKLYLANLEVLEAGNGHGIIWEHLTYHLLQVFAAELFVLHN